jgi:hypothetical protein
MRYLNLLIIAGCFQAACTAVRTSAPLPFRHSFLLHEEVPPAREKKVFHLAINTSSPQKNHQFCSEHFHHPLLNSCEPRLEPEKETPSAQPDREIELKIASLARQHLIGRGGKPAADCSSFVMQVLKEAGVDWSGELGSQRASTAAIYALLAKNGLVHRNRVPRIGELVFFDNTYDRNRNGRADDRLTHIGIVEKVDADGTVHFIHQVKRGVLRYRMNLFHPHQARDKKGKTINHSIRFAPHAGKAHLAGELFVAFGRVK